MHDLYKYLFYWMQFLEIFIWKKSLSLYIYIIENFFGYQLLDFNLYVLSNFIYNNFLYCYFAILWEWNFG